WREGVISSLEGDQDAMADVRAACLRLAEDPGLERVRSFLHERFFDGQAGAGGGGPGLSARSLDLLCGDVLKGGPDPGVSVPIAAGLDRLSARHHLVSVR